jgi:hypothetical protein
MSSLGHVGGVLQIIRVLAEAFQHHDVTPPNVRFFYLGCVLRRPCDAGIYER